MDIHDLETFRAVYEGESLAEVARMKYVSRQALSKTISHLEAELGPLFVRKARGVAPTSLANAVYPHVCRALSELDDVCDISARFVNGQAGSIRLAVEANAALTLPARLFDDYAAARPEVQMNTEILAPSAVREALSSGKADAILAGSPSGSAFDATTRCSDRDPGLKTGPNEDLAFESIFAGGLVVVFSRSAFSPEELDAYASDAKTESLPFVLSLSALSGKRIFGIDPSNSVEHKLIPFLHTHAPDACLTFGNSDTALTTSLMRSGQGGVLVEAQGAQADFGTSSYVHVPLVGDDAPSWEVGVSFHSDSPCAAVACDFARFAREMMAMG
mgnify:CR=1 FL=1